MENRKIEVLGHGYIKFIEAWGKGECRQYEAAIVEAARQSTQGSFRGWDKDEKLLRFLWTMKHSTPFEFCGMTIEIQAPIFVFREWHRHRTQSYSEMSARYAPLPNLNYMPTVERCLFVSGANKQAGKVKGSGVLTHELALDWLHGLSDIYDRIEAHYQKGLAIGIPKEVARCPIPVGRYSRMRATANLRNWLAFLLLRLDPAAQWEIRQYARIVGQIIREIFPKTWSIFEETTPFSTE